jgi:methylamine dehydrogenase heavy chain
MLTAALLSLLAPAHAALESDPMGQVVQLPEQYPAHWVIAHDIAFSHIRDGKGVVFDADADTIAQQFKGMFSSSFAAHFVQATTRPEMYVAETFYSRGTRGERLDVLTIYDKGTLAPVGEVLLESNSRSIVLPQKFAMQLTADESMLLVYNFSPAMSVSVVDLIGRRYLGDVPLPGCAPVFPTGQRGFSSLCADGTLYTVMLDDAGKAASSARTDQFFDSEADPPGLFPQLHREYLSDRFHVVGTGDRQAVAGGGRSDRGMAHRRAGTLGCGRERQRLFSGPSGRRGGHPS